MMGVIYVFRGVVGVGGVFCCCWVGVGGGGGGVFSHFFGFLGEDRGVTSIFFWRFCQGGRVKTVLPGGGLIPLSPRSCVAAGLWSSSLGNTLLKFIFDKINT